MAYEIEPVLRDWLLDTDPALRWQVERDLLDAPEEAWVATRALVATEGFGAELLSLQDPDGQWAGGAFFPSDFAFDGPEAAPGAGQPWTATTWGLNSLREWGLDASVLAGTAEKIAANSRWEYDDLPYWGGEVDACINAFTLANGAWLGADVSALARWFPEHQLPDGGWNCEWVEGSTRSSFQSTLNTIKGLLWYERHTGGDDSLRVARRAAEEYLLERRLMYRRTTGEIVGSVGDPLRLPVPGVLQRAERGRPLPRGVPRTTAPPRPADDRRHRGDPRRAPTRRHLAAGAASPRPGLVRDRRAGGGAVAVAHLPRAPGAPLVGRPIPTLLTTLIALGHHAGDTSGRSRARSSSWARRPPSTAVNRKRPAWTVSPVTPNAASGAAG